jgi:flavodoxin
MSKAISYYDWDLNFKKRQKHHKKFLIRHRSSVLIIYYSRTGTTKKIAEIIGQVIAQDLQCTAGVILDCKNRKGVIGWVKSGLDAIRKNLTRLQKPCEDPESNSLIILGTPIWVRDMATPIRTYIEEHKRKFKNVAFFCTEWRSGGQWCFKKMAQLCNMEPIASLELKSKKIKKELHEEKVNDIVDKLRKDLPLSKLTNAVNASLSKVKGPISLGMSNESYRDFMKKWKEKSFDI